MTQYDYIVIGAGSAGCAIANRLTEAKRVIQIRNQKFKFRQNT